MRVDEFDFDLPESLIALRPARPRRAARLLVVEPGPADAPFGDARVEDLPDLLSPRDLLVFNDTRVIPARLRGERWRAGVDLPVSCELMLHRRLDESRWLAFARPAKRLKPGDRIRFGGEGRVCLLGTLDATVEARGERGEVTLAFDFAGATLDEAIAALGEMPLPPYIEGRRATDEADLADYQTVLAAKDGAVAAPTAALHFDEVLLAALDAKGVGRVTVTLHVGAGTFLPVTAEDTEDHRMHAEWGEIAPEAADRINAARAGGGRIVCVGTTSLRLLESAAGEDGTVRPFRGETDIFITPGYRFRAADMLMTNFHLPRSTLFMLVSAFSGTARMKAAYAHAIAQGYRFYSYGDSSLLSRAP